MCAFVVFCLVFRCQAKRLAWGTSPIWPILCRVGRKTLTQSINLGDSPSQKITDIGHIVGVIWKCTGFSLLNHSVTHCTRSSDCCLCHCVQLDDAQFYDESKRQDSSTKVRTFADHPCCKTVCTVLLRETRLFHVYHGVSAARPVCHQNHS